MSCKGYFVEGRNYGGERKGFTEQQDEQMIISRRGNKQAAQLEARKN